MVFAKLFGPNTFIIDPIHGQLPLFAELFTKIIQVNIPPLSKLRLYWQLQIKRKLFGALFFDLIHIKIFNLIFIKSIN